LQILRANSADAGALFALEQRCFQSDRMTLRQFKRHIGSDTAAVLVAKNAQAILGSAVLFFRQHLRQARLYSLAIDPSARGQGLGEKLLLAAIAKARGHAHSLRLEVRLDNATALHLYQKHGFVVIAQLSHYYQDGADALRMLLALR
jgi:[ribosomal protein S18]-alanine N-acetyltransferase